MGKFTFKRFGYVIRYPRAFFRCLEDAVRSFVHNELLREFGSTKSDKGLPGHNYARVYNALFHDKRDQVTAVCEVGLLITSTHGGNRNGERFSKKLNNIPSLSVWRKYFPNAKVVGFDIKDFTQPTDDYTTVIQGDQKSRDDLKKIVDTIDQFDIIIDDGLHASEHQQVTFSYLFKHLKPGGVFFIEDLCAQLPEYEKPEIPKTTKLLQELQYSKTWSSPVATLEEKEYIESHVKKVRFYDSQKDMIGSTLKIDNIAAIFKK